MAECPWVISALLTALHTERALYLAYPRADALVGPSCEALVRVREKPTLGLLWSDSDEGARRILPLNTQLCPRVTLALRPCLLHLPRLLSFC